MRPCCKELLALALLCLSSCVPVHQAAAPSTEYSPELRSRVDSLFARFNDAGPGCAVGVLEHGGRRYMAGFGQANIATHSPITPSSLFAIASVSKQFTAFSLLLLVYEHRLSLDESIRRTIPELPASYEPITLRELLAHTSGLPEYEDVYNQKGGPDYDTATRADQLRVVIDSIAPQSPAGSAWRYANTNYLLAGIAVERASRRPLAKFARQRIFLPLGMRDSAYVGSAQEIRPLRAMPYQLDAAGKFVPALYGAHAGPTGVQTTVVDLAKWADNFYRPKVGNPDLITQMQQPVSLLDGTLTSAALGLEHKRLGKHDAILHTGVTVGTRAAFVRFPAASTTVVLLCNRIDVNTERLAGQIADVLFQ